MNEKKTVQITIFQAPLVSLVEHKLYIKMYDMEHPFRDPVPAEYYLPVFKGEVDCPERLPVDETERVLAILEEIFHIFNTAHPVGYCGRSLSIGDVVLMEGKHYLCVTVGFVPVIFKTSERSLTPKQTQRSCEITLPSGEVLRATAYQDTEYPSINIDLLPADGEVTRLCFAEHNPEKPAGHELCIGVYCSDEDDTVYYSSYYKESEE